MLDLSPVIAESLAGKRIAITGATGFVGTALVERLLRSVPECELVLLVRDGKRTPAAQRVQRELLKNDAFDRLRERARPATAFAADDRRGGSRRSPATSDRRARPDRRRPSECSASCDIVIHSAAAVSFDSPLDSAVEINLLGPTRIATLLNELGVDAAPRRRVDVLRRRQPPRQRARGARQRRARSTSV